VPYAKQSSAKAKHQKINNRWASVKEIMRKKQNSLGETNRSRETRPSQSTLGEREGGGRQKVMHQAVLKEPELG
jgi:hypothetical protein